MQIPVRMCDAAALSEPRIAQCGQVEMRLCNHGLGCLALSSHGCKAALHFSQRFFQSANLQLQGVSIAIAETIDRSFVMREKETCIWLPFHFLSTLS